MAHDPLVGSRVAAPDTLEDLVVAARDAGLTPSQAAASLAVAQANALGAGPEWGRELRVMSAEHGPLQVALQVVPQLGDDPALRDPASLGRVYELLLAPQRRRRSGAHLTPAAIARGLVGCIDRDWTKPCVVLDPAAGGGAFLLAVLDAMVDAGVEPRRALESVHGRDIDPEIVGVAEAALALWALGHDLLVGANERLIAADGLLDELPACDVLVGNPPFLNQLRADTTNMGERREALRDRLGDLVTAYTDEAWLFLGSAAEHVADDGHVAMVQPVSVLAARHARTLRQRLTESATLEALWLSNGAVFDVPVEVCGVVLRSGSRPAQRVRRWSGSAFEPRADAAAQPDADRWGSVAAVAAGIPAVAPAASDAEVLGQRCTVTAGFRDQFYGFAPFVADGAPDSPREAPLVTVGMIDPFTLHWGSGTSFRFVGEKYVAPSVDTSRLANDDPKLAAWTADRQRPKVLVATQTRVIEAWVDERGTAIPATPVLSIEPHEVDDDELWLIAAALASPVTSARLAASTFGTALSLGAIKCSAADLRGVELPRDLDAWQRGALLVRELQSATAGDRTALLRAFGEVMVAASGVDDRAVLDWWLDRLQSTRRRG